MCPSGSSVCPSWKFNLDQAKDGLVMSSNGKLSSINWNGEFVIATVLSVRI